MSKSTKGNTEGDVTPEGSAPAAPAAPKKVKKAPYVVNGAECKSLCARSHIIPAGLEIKAADLKGGQDTLDKLVKSGLVIKN